MAVHCKDEGLNETRPAINPVKLVSACGSPVVCDEVLEVKQMTLYLDDGSKSVFRNVKFLVSDDADDILLGRSFIDKIGFTLADFLKENSSRLQGLDMSHDIATDDYVARGSATDGIFGRVARRASSRIFLTSSAPESLLPVDCKAVESFSYDRATWGTFSSESNADLCSSSRAVTSSDPVLNHKEKFPASAVQYSKSKSRADAERRDENGAVLADISS